jgi:ferredoxin
MIVAELKPIEEILEMVKDYQKVLIVGCKGCVAVCNAGGPKEVSILGSLLRIARRKRGHDIIVDEKVLDRQCEPKLIEQLTESVQENNYDAILSLACSIGPQYIAEAFDTMVVLPGLNTTFMGGTVEHGIWGEYCAACGSCGIHNFGGLCPITRCAKGLLNGPRGGDVDGRCEVNKDMECVWELIYQRMKKLGQLDRLAKQIGAKDWSTSLSGGPRKIIREDLTL